MIVSYKVDINVPKQTLFLLELDLYREGCIYQKRYFKTHTLYIISDYFDHDKEHQRIFVECIMNHVLDYILPSNSLNKPIYFTANE